MEQQVYLVVKLEGALYGFGIESVQEILELPQLQTLPDMSPVMAGFLNFRGEVIQVIDLKYLIGGGKKKPYVLTDIMVVVKAEEARICGMVVPEVLGVMPLKPAVPWKGMKESSDLEPAHFSLSLGVTELKEELVFIFDPAQLYKAASGEENRKVVAEGGSHFNAVSEDMPIFFERAQIIMQAPKEKKGMQNTLIVVSAHQEQYGIEPDAVEEFCELESITLMPYASGPIWGFINLRGDTLPIVDVWGFIQSKKSGVPSHSQVLVVTYKEKLIGIPVEKVVSIAKLTADDFRNVPLTVKFFGEELVKGMAVYGKHPLAILDLNQLLKYTLAPYGG